MSRILVVDDSKFSRNRLVTPLTNAGYEVITADNGRAGLDAYGLETPDLVISDLLMPELDGFGLVEAIRVIDQLVPIIIVSADIQNTSRLRIEELGVSKFLNKPFAPPELLACVRELLNPPPGPCDQVPADTSDYCGSNL